MSGSLKWDTGTVYSPGSNSFIRLAVYSWARLVSDTIYPPTILEPARKEVGHGPWLVGCTRQWRSWRVRLTFSEGKTHKFRKDLAEAKFGIIYLHRRVHLKLGMDVRDDSGWERDKCILRTCLVSIKLLEATEDIIVLPYFSPNPSHHHLPNIISFKGSYHGLLHPWVVIIWTQYIMHTTSDSSRSHKQMITCSPASPQIAQSCVVQYTDDPLIRKRSQFPFIPHWVFFLGYFTSGMFTIGASVGEIPALEGGWLFVCAQARYLWVFRESSYMKLSQDLWGKKLMNLQFSSCSKRFWWNNSLSLRSLWMRFPQAKMNARHELVSAEVSGKMQPTL